MKEIDKAEQAYNTARQRLLTGIKTGIGVLAVDAAVGYMDAANTGPLRSLDIRPVYHLPLVVAGATLAISGALGFREIKKPDINE